MKRLTTILSLALVSSVGFAQSQFTTAKQMGDLSAETVSYNNSTSSLAPCDYEVMGTFENGYGPTNDPNVIWADDFVVKQGESMTLTQIAINILLQPGVTVDEADFYFYSDTGMGPGDQIGGQIEVEVASQEVVGSAFGFDVREVIFEMDPFVFEGSDTEETIYWIGQTISFNGANAYFEVTSLVNTPNELYVWDAQEGAWYPGSQAFEDPQLPSDIVRTVYGECNVLSVNNNQLSGVSVYPNPATDVLNINTPANVTVESVALFDMLGKSVNAQFSNGVLNTSGLSRGVYLLQINTTEGTLTQKIVKK